jgi:ankyrin repeat protein
MASSSSSSSSSSRPLVAAVSRDLFDAQDTIQRAAYEGNLALVEMLRRKGASVAARDLDGRSALHWACAGGRLHVLQHMLDEYNNVPHNAHNAAAGALHASHSGLSFTRLINAADDAGWTPLHSAVSSGHVGAIRFLLEHGADARAATKRGRTVLHYLKGSEPVAELVVPALGSADLNILNAQDELGHTALHRAAARGEAGVVRLLLDHGCSANVRDCDGNTALHSACEANEGDVCLLFLRHAACSDIGDVRNNKGQTPADACATGALRRRIFLLHDGDGDAAKEDIA